MRAVTRWHDPCKFCAEADLAAEEKEAMTIATSTRSNEQGTSAEQTVADYVGDMAALEAHIEEALDRQLKPGQGDVTVAAVMQEFHSLVKRHRNALIAIQEQTGATVGNPIKAAGAAVLGKAAGLVDQLRDETLAKALRDDDAAFSLAVISYSMLHAMALELGNARVASLVERHLTDYAGAIERINEVMPGIVQRELREDGLQLDAAAEGATRKMVSSAWQSTNR